MKEQEKETKDTEKETKDTETKDTETKDTETKDAETKDAEEANKLFFILHFLINFLLFLLLILSPLKYYKYIAWIFLAISLHWIIFNGCIFDYLHHNHCNNNNIPTNNVTPFLELFNKEFANYIDNNYFKNTMRPTYIIFFICILLLTIIIYRLIYNIEFF